MGRHLLLLSVCWVLYTVTNGQEPEDTSIIPDELDIQRWTVRPRPTGFSNEELLHYLKDLIGKAKAARKPSASTPARPATTPQSLTESINDCGLSSSSVDQGGETMQDTEFPWLGGLFELAGDVYLCTVNLVSAKHAVTAAHCFESTNADDFGIRWGHPRTSQSEAYTNLSLITVHPGHIDTLHDVAVVELSNAVTFTVSLKPICLWQATWSPGKGITGTVAGFGPNYEDLKKFEMLIVTQETCRASHRKFHYYTSEFTFCAGRKNLEVGPCIGDAGAGYMQWVEDRYYLRGLVLFTLLTDGTCDPQEYIIFADLSKEVDWIVEMVFNGATRKPSASTPAQPATTPQSLTKSINDCGLANSSLVQGGEAMQDTEFPWLGGLFERAQDVYTCTVNLVSAKHAVTAAHCFESTNADDFGIRWGHPRTSQSEAYTNLSSITVHPGHIDTLHDVAVVELSNAVTFTVSLKPICLWQTTWSPGKDITGTVAGFGPNYEDLKKFEMLIVTQETCRASHRKFHYYTSEFTFCAGRRNLAVGPCIGDAGAGYMQWVEDRYYLRGLVLFSLLTDGTCDPQEYIIFADLSKEVDWLVEMVS